MKAKLIILFILFFSASLLSAQKPDDIIGKWYTEGKECIVEIYKTGEKYFGKFAWFKSEYDTKNKKDINNPNENLRSRLVLGTTFMTDFVFDDDEWVDGRVYNPEDGNTYKAILSLEDENTLKMRGYVGIPALGQSVFWTKVE